MSEPNFSGLTTPMQPVQANGTHRATKKNKPAHKGAVASDAHAAPQSGPRPMETTFVIIEAAPIDAPMWPIHAAWWLQSGQTPSIPAWTSLAIERHHRIPAPDFLHSDSTSPNRPGAVDTSRDVLKPLTRREFPQSDLTPLGWDPRAVCRTQGDQ